jgi:hypothetical protein
MRMQMRAISNLRYGAWPKEEAGTLGGDGQLEGDALRASLVLWILVMRQSVMWLHVPSACQ